MDETQAAQTQATVLGQVAALCDDSLREEVGKLCGWVPYDGVQTIAYMWAPGHISNVVPTWMRTINDTVDFLIELPNYPADLNAMHEIIVEALKDEAFRNIYREYWHSSDEVEPSARTKAEWFVKCHAHLAGEIEE